jgi:hypothetical protein
VRVFRKVIIAAVLLALPGAALANYVYRAGDGSLPTIFAFECGLVICPAQVLMDSNGAEKGTPANPLTVTTQSAGSTGTDFSANASAVPVIGSFVALTTLPVTPARASVEVQNQSAGVIQIVRDDGTGANKTSLFLYGPNSWKSTTFKGRLTIYGISGAQVAAYQD